MQVPGERPALRMGNVKAVYRVDPPPRLQAPTHPPKRRPLFAALLPCCYVPPAHQGMTGRGEGGMDVGSPDQRVGGIAAAAVAETAASQETGQQVITHDEQFAAQEQFAQKAVSESRTQAPRVDAAAEQDGYVVAHHMQGSDVCRRGDRRAPPRRVAGTGARHRVRVTQRTRKRVVTRIVVLADGTVAQRVDNTTAQRGRRMVLRMRRRAPI